MRVYITGVFEAMARGLFASLIVGTILNQLGELTGFGLLQGAGQAAVLLMGPAIAAALAFEREAAAFTTLGAVVAGTLGAGNFVGGSLAGVGEPVGALLSALVAVELGRQLEGRSRFDILIIPAATILAGAFVAQTAAPYISAALMSVGSFVNEFTQLQPLPMGILLGTVMGMLLTMPVSSAGLAIAIGLDGLAAGAAVAGGAAQMVGFAVAGFPENRISGLFTQGFGTSMLQFSNIIQNPLIWLPPTLAGALGGGLSATVFEMRTTSVGAGMGTSGLVGQLTTHAVMGDSAILSIILLHFVIPAIVSFGLAHSMRACGLIRQGDMQL